MIDKFYLRNFKSINTLEHIELKNLSIICGSNSSGKSSMIQAILMLSQTFGSRYFESTISLNGRLVRLGSFSDILNHKLISEEDGGDISMSIDLSFSKDASPAFDIKKVSLNLVFSGRTGSSKKPDDDFHPGIESGEIRLEKYSSSFVELIRFSKKSNVDNMYKVDSIELSNEDEINKNYPGYKIEGVIKKELIPHILQLNYDHTKKLSLGFVSFLINNTLDKKLKIPGFYELQSELEGIAIPLAVIDKIKSLIIQENNERVENFKVPEELLEIIQNNNSLTVEKVRSLIINQSLILTPATLSLLKSDVDGGFSIDAWINVIDRVDQSVKKELGDFLIRHRDVIQGTWYSNMKKTRKPEKFQIQALRELNYFLGYMFSKKIKYLGPLRNEPQAMYQAFDLSELDVVGLKGEYTAAVLHVNQSKKIRYPKITSTDNNHLSYSIATDTLANACTEWLSYLGVVTEVKTYDKGKLGYELRVKTSESDNLQDLTHVGVGVSQILPIVVMALLSDEDEVLIFEQPELHLHPKVQSRLCDFFLAISNRNKQCIIETHSEYIINRLRRRIAQSRDESIEKKSSVLFFEKFSDVSVVRKVDINKYGAIIDWPKDFFDQSDEEVEGILMDATLKRIELKNGEFKL